MSATKKVAWGRRVSVCLAFAGMLCLAACQSASDVKPVGAVKADSLVSADPPVKPSGPGGGPY